jgi:hypothetical protein
MKKPVPQKQYPDYLFAFSCALNLGLYAADPGPQAVVVGSSDEQRTISRREHYLDLYSRMLLLHLEGDPDRLSAVVAEAQLRLNEKSARSPDPHDLKIRADTVEIAETALRMIRDAGADVDQQIRKRLLTVMNYQTSRDIFGTFLGDPSLAGPPDSMIDDLNRIDQNDQDQ